MAFISVAVSLSLTKIYADKNEYDTDANQVPSAIYLQILLILTSKFNRKYLLLVFVTLFQHLSVHLLLLPL